MRCTHCNKELEFEEAYYYENSCEQCERNFELAQSKNSRIKLIRMRFKLYLRKIINRFK
ncbi:conserved hypothetical protein [Xenorhabdus bovienii str. kraussei Becker Underwood]|uniref:Uncharacterized protein n=1 Tax=Xenorhabdus bovienii str. kraussei Becker Underwood TaxID=1398204 RepID=A0A077PX72_XENBV|nr:conserved hypothetical protein [Xenorhabdus bovienii str. kraussei Becker Underwood]